MLLQIAHFLPTFPSPLQHLSVFCWITTSCTLLYINVYIDRFKGQKQNSVRIFKTYKQSILCMDWSLPASSAVSYIWMLLLLTYSKPANTSSNLCLVSYWLIDVNMCIFSVLASPLPWRNVMRVKERKARDPPR